MVKTRLEGYGTLLPNKWKEIYEHVDGEDFADSPQSSRIGVPDQVKELLQCNTSTTGTLSMLSSRGKSQHYSP